MHNLQAHTTRHTCLMLLNVKRDLVTEIVSVLVAIAKTELLNFNI